MSGGGEAVVRSMYEGFSALATGADVGAYGRGGGSGTEVELRVFHVIELRDGLIVRMDEYLERGQALEAARRK